MTKKSRVRAVAITSKLSPTLPVNGEIHKRDRYLFEKLLKLERVLGVRPGSEFFNPRKTINPESIPLCKSLIEDHFLKRFITKKDPLLISELTEINALIDFNVHYHDSGAIPAASNPASDYFEHSWTRDTAIIAYTLAITKHLDECEKAIENLTTFYGRKNQRDRFIQFHYHHDPAAKYRYGDPTKELPHIRARIDSDGNLIESDQHWSHSQLDALGMWLFVAFRTANRKELDLLKLDKLITNQVNSDNALESIFVVALKFLNRIGFWDQLDHGPWEDRLEPSRASSIGICLAALKEAERYFSIAEQEIITAYLPESGPSLKDELKNGIKEAERALARRIKLVPSDAIETDRYRSDSALSFLLYPFNPGLSTIQEQNILRSLYTYRMGDVGFTRRDDDEYVGMDYIYNSNSSCFCDIHQIGYKAAEWTLFDPLISAFYYQRYIDASALDDQSYLLGDRHFRRCLTQISKNTDTYRKLFDDKLVLIPPRRIPEAYFWDSKLSKWRANENSPLLMAEAAFALMLERAIEASKLREMVLHRSLLSK